MKLQKITKKGYVGFILVITISFLLIHIVQAAVAADPGTDSNPLVSQDYVDAKINELTAKIDALKGTSNDVSSQVEKYVVVDVRANQQLVVADGTEMILRMGKAKAIGSDLGGLSDVTAGIDIQTGGNIPANHLLIVPRNDGRGLKAVTDLKIMIKGVYAIN